MTKGRKVQPIQKPKLLWIGDAACTTGFGVVSENILSRLVDDWDVHVLGVNYHGDPHTLPFKIYPAIVGGDIYGLNRLESLMLGIRPDVVCILNDSWVVKEYIPILQKLKNAFPFKVVAYIPVDSPNVRKDFVDPLNTLDLVIAYNTFGLNEMQKSGLTTKTAAIPHGVNTKVFHHLDKRFARETAHLNPDFFIVGCVSRNQPRKRIDLAVQYFAEWVKDKPDTVRFYYHGALKDLGYDIVQLCQYFDVEDRLIITSPNMTPANGVSVETLNIIYNCFDVHMLTTLGEGFGLPVAETMACGVPQILPDWSALGEWCRFDDGTPAVEYVPCTGIYVNTGGINTVGGVADKQAFINALDKLYSDKVYRDTLGNLGYKLISQQKYQWSFVSSEFNKLFKQLKNA